MRGLPSPETVVPPVLTDVSIVFASRSGSTYPGQLVASIDHVNAAVASVPAEPPPTRKSC